LLSAGDEVPVQYGRTVTEKNVNSIFNWLEEFGEYFGWKLMDPLDLTALQKAANEGNMVVICAQRKDLNRAGHIAMVVPETNENKAVWQGGEVLRPLTSQAGVNNYSYRQAAAWWKMDQFRDHAFWQHI
jgi:hypothetical protein